MAAIPVLIAPNNASNATFRAWGLAISNALTAAGLPLTADTGQINWTTVAVPVAINTSAGYEIRQFNDTLQATAPVFIRLDYGTGGSVSNPQIQVTVGTATDGAGNITANASFPNSTSTIASGLSTAGAVWGSANSSTVWVDSDGASSMLIAGWVGSLGTTPANGGVMILVERTRNWDGTVNGNGVMILVGSAKTASTPTVQMVLIAQATGYNGHVAATSTALPILVGIGNIVPITSAVEGGVTFTFPVFTGWSPHLNAPSKHLVGALLNDLPTNLQFQIVSYGGLHTFVAWGNNSIALDYAGRAIQLCWRIA